MVGDPESNPQRGLDAWWNFSQPKGQIVGGKGERRDALRNRFCVEVPSKLVGSRSC